jgi:hypothetical protein
MGPVQTFVIRLWEPPAESDDDVDELRGVVEHFGSGRSETFKDDAELLAFLRAGTWERELQVGRHGEGGAS